MPHWGLFPMGTPQVQKSVSQMCFGTETMAVKLDMLAQSDQK